MISERPPLRRRVKAAWRLVLHRLTGTPCKGVYGLPWSLLRHIDREAPITVVDIGAHDGDFTGRLSAWCPVTAAILAEPLPGKTDALRRRFPSNEVRIFAGALGDADGTTTFRINALDSTSSLLRASRDQPDMAALPLGEEVAIPVAIRRLDDVFEESGMGRVDVLKIDVQGAEHLVLRGATKTLARTRLAWIECSVRPLYEGSATFAEIIDLMDEAGFGLHDWDEAMRGATGELLQVDAVFLRRPAQ
jgi:FkbM family methyltransferase